MNHMTTTIRLPYDESIEDDDEFARHIASVCEKHGVAHTHASAKEVNAIEALSGVRVVGVAKRDETDGAPLVYIVYPLRRCFDEQRANRKGYSKGKWSANAGASAWPNALWLAKTKVGRRVGALEHGGGVKRIQDLIHGDEKKREEFARNHRAYAEFRWALLTSDDRRRCEDYGGEYVEALRDRGIGGYYSDDQVKCLHGHYAHYLATDGANVVGSWVQELLDADGASDAALE